MIAPCTHDDGLDNLFCGECGKVKDLNALRSVRVMGFVGAAHSTNPKFEQFWASGDPEVFSQKRKP